VLPACTLPPDAAAHCTLLSTINEWECIADVLERQAMRTYPMCVVDLIRLFIRPMGRLGRAQSHALSRNWTAAKREIGLLMFELIGRPILVILGICQVASDPFNSPCIHQYGTREVLGDPPPIEGQRWCMACVGGPDQQYPGELRSGMRDNVLTFWCDPGYTLVRDYMSPQPTHFH
jgi:hypothetical protein